MNRNDPCHCGSGKRYKHCHGAAADASVGVAAPTPVPAAPRPADPLHTLHLALAQQKAGRLAAAEALYEQALAALPDHFDALHMQGVVKLQLGKWEEGARLLLAGLPLAPAAAATMLQHNLALCLVGLARQQGVLDTLGADPPAPASPAPFMRAYEIPAGDVPASARVSVLVAGVVSARDLEASLASVQAQSLAPAGVVIAMAGDAEARRVAAGSALPCNVVDVDADAPLAVQVAAAADAADGTHLALMHAGDRWSPQRLERMLALLYACGAQWGFCGLRVLRDDGMIAGVASSPETAALLRAQDALYAHRTASLALLDYDPIAAARNLVVATPYWRRQRMSTGAVGDAFLAWAWRRVAEDEPAYLDEPDCLIPERDVRAHLENALARAVALPLGRGRGPDGASGNPHFAAGLARFWAQQWRHVRAMHASSMSRQVLQGCAAMLGVLPRANARAAQELR